MKEKIIISPSVLAADFSCLAAEIKKTEISGAEYLHLDVMDGHFVPNISIGAPVIKALRGKSKLVFDVHLMISEPLRYIDDFVDAGADIITFHVESNSPCDETIEKIRASGVKAALSIKPGTPAKAVFPYLDRLSMVLVMTVEPGFGGQEYMPEMTAKIKEIRDEISRRNLSVDIEVDGGINENTLAVAAKAGANIFVAGSAIYNADDAGEAVERLRAIAGEAQC